jgi:hypothetical protein
VFVEQFLAHPDCFPGRAVGIFARNAYVPAPVYRIALGTLAGTDLIVYTPALGVVAVPIGVYADDNFFIYAHANILKCSLKIFSDMPSSDSPSGT